MDSDNTVLSHYKKHLYELGRYGDVIEHFKNKFPVTKCVFGKIKEECGMFGDFCQGGCHALTLKQNKGEENDNITS